MCDTYDKPPYNKDLEIPLYDFYAAHALQGLLGFGYNVHDMEVNVRVAHTYAYRMIKFKEENEGKYNANNNNRD